MKHHSNKYNSLIEKNQYIKKYQRKVLLSFFLKLALIEIVIIAMIVLPKNITVYEILFGTGIAIFVPYFLLKPKKVFGGTKTGTIANIAYITHKPPRADRIAVDFLNAQLVSFIECTVVDENEEKWTFKLEQRYDKIYHAGDEVVYPGFVKYPINLTSHEFVLCPFCGNIMPRPVTHCVECGALPIDTDSE